MDWACNTHGGSKTEMNKQGKEDVKNDKKKVKEVKETGSK
jgi:hypothetical protein